MRIESRAPFYPPTPQAQQTQRPSHTQPLRATFRPFVQPAIAHRFVRAAQHQYIPHNRRLDNPTAGTYNANSGNDDPTLRPNDPYITKVNKRSFDKQQAVEKLTSHASKWRDWNQNGKTEIAYTFKSGQGSFSEIQRQKAQQSMTSWADVANLTFTENARSAEGRVSFLISNDQTTATGFHPANHKRAGDTIYNPEYVTRSTLTHEIGHALGLTHPGNYNHAGKDEKRTNDDFAQLRDYAEDSRAHTVMSYLPSKYSGKLIGSTPKAPMMDDISAIQHIYGVNHQTRRENNTYGFNSNSGRDYYSLKSSSGEAAFCIWDGAGNDTLDVSGYGNNQIINLRAGSFSDVGGLRGNISIARDCNIENAIGGSGHDALIGNDADNRLTGAGGADRLRGGRGADTFVYNYASDSTPEAPDEIMDFTSGVDKIDVSGALKSAGLNSLSFVSNWSGKAAEARLSYDEKTGTGLVSIDLTGNGQPDLLIRTHGQVRPEDILPFHNAMPRTPPALIQPRVDSATVRPPFTFNNASESPFNNARLFTNFTSGTHKLDLRGLEKQSNTRLTLVKQFSGRAGEVIVGYNSHSYRYFVSIDLTGNRSPDFLVKSTQVIKPKDILVN